MNVQISNNEFFFTDGRFNKVKCLCSYSFYRLQHLGIHLVVQKLFLSAERDGAGLELSSWCMNLCCDHLLNNFVVVEVAVFAPSCICFLLLFIIAVNYVWLMFDSFCRIICLLLGYILVGTVYRFFFLGIHSVEVHFLLLIRQFILGLFYFTTDCFSWKLCKCPLWQVHFLFLVKPRLFQTCNFGSVYHKEQG